ncbi:PREDICTED: mitochondrial carrier homolog 2-like [Haliaeetus leucocephalus]|uniref:mitochondrial carrier homolog 2-like n=1 Tax=Haliaeetus leucocephalus TaxID=52644 RepID=UPI00053CEDAD|nr:PREDICTED: mitochondrial carrier homolog 2-like [Haliaeetus leucocephalus]
MADAASQVLLGSGLTVLSQPLMYVKVLVQVGYEPLPPTLGRNVFGRQVYQLPGLFAYAKHIVKVDGRAGLFKGLTPRLCSSAIGTVVHGKVLQRYQEAEQAEAIHCSLANSNPDCFIVNGKDDDDDDDGDDDVPCRMHLDSNRKCLLKEPGHLCTENRINGKTQKTEHRKAELGVSETFQGPDFNSQRPAYHS